MAHTTLGSGRKDGLPRRGRRSGKRPKQPSAIVATPTTLSCCGMILLSTRTTTSMRAGRGLYDGNRAWVGPALSFMASKQTATASIATTLGGMREIAAQVTWILIGIRREGGACRRA